MDRTVEAVNLASAGSHLSLWGLFVEADIVVKLVMIGLLAASVWVWAIAFEKWSACTAKRAALIAPAEVPHKIANGLSRG